MPEQPISPDRLLACLTEMAEASLPLWSLPEDATVQLVNVSENATFLIEADGNRAVLRIHREGYHSRMAIESELAWMAALSADLGLETPEAIVGRNGETVQVGTHPRLAASRFMILFAFIEGKMPEEHDDLTEGFETLGALAAKCHTHVLKWQKPIFFSRFSWDAEAVFGDTPTWGQWRDAPGVTTRIAQTLARVETQIVARLDAFGRAPDRFNLIHADMRLANLLVSESGTRLIDFDDCGFGWFLYDFAAAISFMEDDPRVPSLKAAWLRGYRRVRDLTDADEAEMDTFVMLRRMALLAWIGSHIDAPEPQALAHDFAERTAKLGEAWLDGL